MGSLGKKLVKSLLAEKDFSVLVEYRISEDDLFDEAKSALKWCNQYLLEHKAFPTEAQLAESTGIYLPDTTEPLRYVCELVRKRSFSKYLENHLKKAVDLLENRDPDACYNEIVETAAKALRKSKSAMLFRETGDLRYQRYLELRKTGGYLGIETPWKSLNKAIQGWINGCFHTIVAHQNTGKSWFLVICASHCLSLGKKVLFVTMEMSSERIFRRLDATHYKLPFGDFRDGMLDDTTVETWKSSLEGDKYKNGDVLVADKSLVRTVADIQGLVFKYSPDIVLIDGGYRLEPMEQKKNLWEAMSTVVYDLQLYAELSGIPWVVTTQLGDASETGKFDTEKGKKIHLRPWNARYSKEWIIAPDISIALFQNEELRMLRLMEMHLLKERDGTSERAKNSITIKWDFEKMNFDEAVPDDNDSDFPEMAYF